VTKLAMVSSSRSPFVQGSTASLPSGKVNYTLSDGPPSAPLLVCVHGLNGAVSSFQHLEPLLTQGGLRVLLFDLYGFGASASPRGRLDLLTYVEQLAGLLDVLRPEGAQKVHLLGYSMGGVIAVEFARRYPQRVSRLLLVAPGGLLAREGTPCAPLLFKGLRGPCGCSVLALATCAAMVCSCWVRRALSKGLWFQPDVRQPELYHDVSRENTRRFAHDPSRSVNSYLRALRRMPLWQEDARHVYAGFARGPVPVLFLWGAEDCVVPHCEAQEDIVALFGKRGASCVRLEGAGHGLLLEEADQVAGCAQAWFSDSQDPEWLECLRSFRLAEPTEAPLSAPVAPDTIGLGV